MLQEVVGKQHKSNIAVALFLLRINYAGLYFADIFGLGDA